MQNTHNHLTSLITGLALGEPALLWLADGLSDWLGFEVPLTVLWFLLTIPFVAATGLLAIDLLRSGAARRPVSSPRRVPVPES